MARIIIVGVQIKNDDLGVLLLLRLFLLPTPGGFRLDILFLQKINVLALVLTIHNIAQERGIKPYQQNGTKIPRKGLKKKKGEDPATTTSKPKMAEK